VVSVTLSVCPVCMSALKGNRLELSTANLVDIQCMQCVMALAQLALTQRSKGRRSRSCGYQMHSNCGYTCQKECLGFLIQSFVARISELTA